MQTPADFGVTLDADLQALWNANELMVNEEIERVARANEVWSTTLEDLVEAQIDLVGIQRKRNAMSVVKKAIIVGGIIILAVALLSLIL